MTVPGLVAVAATERVSVMGQSLLLGGIHTQSVLQCVTSVQTGEDLWDLHCPTQSGATHPLCILTHGKGVSHLW